MAKTKAEKSKLIIKHTILASLLVVIATLLVGVLLPGHRPAKADDVIVYKSPTCGCCNEWVDHLRENGFKVAVYDQRNMDPIKRHKGVPRRLQSCHTAQVGEYIIEGHVPADDIARLLRERPSFKGLTVPGMPMGSPGMEGPRNDPYEVLTFQPDGKTSVFARHNQ